MSRPVIDSSYGFTASPKLPLVPLSSGRVNVASRSPFARDESDSLTSTLFKGFGHPEFGVPGDFGSKDFVLGEDFGSGIESTFAASSNSDLKPPSIPASPTKHARASSDVQAMVSRFNTLNIKDHAEQRRRDAAALKRAQMGREEAEAEASRLRSNLQNTQELLEDGKKREEQVAKRLEDVMDDLQRAKAMQSHNQSLYEKEIRKAKKEAFKSASTVVKFQEELKAAREALRSVQSELDLERIKVDRREKDTFNAQYELAEFRENMTKYMARIEALEAEHRALHSNFKEEQEARAAAEEKLVQLASISGDSFGSPKNKQPETRAGRLTKLPHSTTIKLEQLHHKLKAQADSLIHAEDLIHFMQMECQLGCCSCKALQNQHVSFIQDRTFNVEMQRIRAEVAEMLLQPLSVKSEAGVSNANEDREPTTTNYAADEFGIPQPFFNLPTPAVPAEEQHQGKLAADVALQVELSRNPGTTDANSMDISLLRGADDLLYAPDSDLFPIAVQGMPSAVSHITTTRMLTTTKTIPLVDHSNTDYSIFSTPTGLTREQAIEQLRQRRGRARSVTGTPRKLGDEPVTPRRDISAPQMTKNVVTPGSCWRKILV